MRKCITLLFLISISIGAFAQKSDTQSLVGNPEFEKELKSLLRFSVPVIGVDDLASNEAEYIILDAREKSEFDVSHIPCSIHIGYKKADYDELNGVDKSHPIAVYCSVGYRSEKIGEKLMKRGFENVYNVYGSIFEWANRGHLLIDKRGNETKTVHTYNKSWSKWVDSDEVKKVW